MEHQRPRYPLTEAFKLLGMSRAKGYLRVRDGQLSVVRDGGTPYVTAEEVDRYARTAQPAVDYRTAKARRTG